MKIDDINSFQELVEFWKREHLRADMDGILSNMRIFVVIDRLICDSIERYDSVPYSKIYEVYVNLSLRAAVKLLLFNRDNIKLFCHYLGVIEELNEELKE